MGVTGTIKMNSMLKLNRLIGMSVLKVLESLLKKREKVSSLCILLGGYREGSTAWGGSCSPLLTEGFSSLIPSSLIMIIIVVIHLSSTSLLTSFTLPLLLVYQTGKGIHARVGAEPQAGRQRGLWLRSQAPSLCLSLPTCKA